MLEKSKQKKLILESGKETWSDSSILLLWNKLCDGPTDTIFLYGLPEQYLENITLDHITATAKNGMKVNNVNDLVIKDIVIHEEPSR